MCNAEYPTPVLVKLTLTFQLPIKNYGQTIIRMEDTRLPKMVFNAKPEGRPGVGRPRLRWLDDVEADIKALGIKRWRIRAQDRKGLSAILREAKAKLKGP
jgi:hypothetical protein